MESDENLHSTVEDVFKDFNGRRSGLIKALTTDVEEFYQQCDPKRENLGLYGLPTGDWEVNEPPEEVPSELPEPILGINFSRGGTLEQDWIYLVSMHSDSWLLAVAYYFGARFRLDKANRQRLFDMINELPTVYEVVVEAQKHRSTIQKHKSTITYASSSKSKSSSNEKYVKWGAEDEAEGSDEEDVGSDEEDEGPEEEDVGEHDDSKCGICRKNYLSSEFWIYCYTCQRWFHGKCVKITESQYTDWIAESTAKGMEIPQYECPSCASHFD